MFRFSLDHRHRPSAHRNFGLSIIPMTYIYVFCGNSSTIKLIKSSSIRPVCRLIWCHQQFLMGASASIHKTAN